MKLFNDGCRQLATLARLTNKGVRVVYFSLDPVKICLVLSPSSLTAKGNEKASCAARSIDENGTEVWAFGESTYVHVRTSGERIQMTAVRASAYRQERSNDTSDDFVYGNRKHSTSSSSRTTATAGHPVQLTDILDLFIYSIQICRLWVIQT
jgi:hypothetical protein